MEGNEEKELLHTLIPHTLLLASERTGAETNGLTGHGILSVTRSGAKMRSIEPHALIGQVPWKHIIEYL